MNQQIPDMSSKYQNKKQRIGWGVRPLDWDDGKDESSDFDEENEDVEVTQDDTRMEDKEFAKWVSMKWNLDPFDETKPVNERKHEWGRFSEQFERIIGVRHLSSKQKLQAFRIQSGQFLNDIIKMQMKRGMGAAEKCYEQVMLDLNAYFDQTCDAMQERSIFRQIKMSQDELFVDYQLRCEKQMKYCNFSIDQADEELADALIRRSIPEISKQLRLLAPTIQNDIFSIIKQGAHLDSIRKEEQLNNQEVEVKPVMSVRRETFPKYNVNNHRQSQYQKNFQHYNEKPRNWVPRFRNAPISKIIECGKCSRHHEIGSCPARGRRCMNCKRYGHFAKCCKSTTSRDSENEIKNEAMNINQVNFGKDIANESSNEEN